jgi:hypothetical protein
MKKIFTLAFGLLLTVAMFAADRKPTVTISSMKQYSIVVDGRQYSSSMGSMSLSNLHNGRHTIQVFDARFGFFMRSKKLVASSSFQLKNNDLQITIDRGGQLQISESRFGRDWNGQDYGRGNDHDRSDSRDAGRDQGNHNRRF